MASDYSLLAPVYILIPLFILGYILLAPIQTREKTARQPLGDMSRLVPGNKAREATLIAELREITGASQADAAKLAKRHKTLEGAIDGFYSDPVMQIRASGAGADKAQEKKLGEIWEKFKDPSAGKITIEGTMELCEELGIDPENDVVLFCLATDLGSKSTGEWEKAPWISGWASMPGGIDSLEGMKNRLPGLREKLYSEPAYFKSVYMHTFDLAKAPGARTLTLDTALSLWKAYIPPALAHTPSALSHLPPNTPFSTQTGAPPQFTKRHLDLWLEFQTQKGKAVSKDTWSLFVDFVRSIDDQFETYDEEAAWPSTIDDFVEFVRKQG